MRRSGSSCSPRCSRISRARVNPPMPGIVMSSTAMSSRSPAVISASASRGALNRYGLHLPRSRLSDHDLAVRRVVVDDEDALSRELLKSLVLGESRRHFCLVGDEPDVERRGRATWSCARWRREPVPAPHIRPWSSARRGPVLDAEQLMVPRARTPPSRPLPTATRPIPGGCPDRYRSSAAVLSG